MSRGRIWHAPIRFEQRLAYRPRVGRLRHCVRLVILSVEHVGMVPAKFFKQLDDFSGVSAGRGEYQEAGLRHPAG